MHKKEHDAWHEGAGDGDFNLFWNVFILSEKNAPNGRYTVAQIIDKLNACRSEFPITVIE